jgi:hypothetical protein
MKLLSSYDEVRAVSIRVKATHLGEIQTKEGVSQQPIEKRLERFGSDLLA